MLPDFSPQAVDDLKAILVHVAQDSPSAAQKLVGRLKDKAGIERGAGLPSARVNPVLEESCPAAAWQFHGRPFRQVETA